MRKVHGHHVLDSVAKSLIAHTWEDDQNRNYSNQHVSHYLIETRIVFHTRVKIENDAISFKIENRYAKKQWQIKHIHVSDIGVQLWLGFVLFFWVNHYDNKS